jgi:hypothetical protein
VVRIQGHRACCRGLLLAEEQCLHLVEDVRHFDWYWYCVRWMRSKT